MDTIFKEPCHSCEHFNDCFSSDYSLEEHRNTILDRLLLISVNNSDCFIEPKKDE